MAALAAQPRMHYRWARNHPNPKQRAELMTKDELIIQLVKIGIGILIGGYFLWWSLEVLHRLPPVH